MPRPRAAVSTHVLRALAIFVAWLAGAGIAAARPAAFDGVPVERLQEVIDRCYNLEDDALAQIEQLRRDFPTSLAPEVIAVTRLYWLQSYIEIDPALTRHFERDAEALLDKAQRRLRNHGDDPDVIVLAALSHLALGGFYAEYERWWPAFWRVRAGRALSQRALKVAPDHPEAKMPLGVLECYLAQTPPYLRPLARMLGASGSLETGLQHLRTARDEAVFTANEAVFYLCVIESDLRGDYAAARAAIEQLALRYPENPFFQRRLGVLEVRSGLHEQGRTRLRAIPDMRHAQAMPALAVRALIQLYRDGMNSGDYTEALDASTRAGAISSADPRMRRFLSQALIAQGEALHALGRDEEAFACFEAVPAEDAASRKLALARLREIKRETETAD